MFSGKFFSKAELWTTTLNRLTTFLLKTLKVAVVKHTVRTENLSLKAPSHALPLILLSHLLTEVKVLTASKKNRGLAKLAVSEGDCKLICALIVQLLPRKHRTIRLRVEYLHSCNNTASCKSSFIHLILVFLCPLFLLTSIAAFLTSHPMFRYRKLEPHS